MSSAMKSNGLLKWLMIPVVLAVVLGATKLLSGNRSGRALAPSSAGALTPEEMKALGIEGDTPHDTVATLVGQVKQLRQELQKTRNGTQAQQTENDRLRQREADVEQRIQSALAAERDTVRQDREQIASDTQQTQGLLQEMQQRLAELGKHGTQVELPVDLELRGAPGQALGPDDLTWFEPQDRPSAKSGGQTSNRLAALDGDFAFPTAFGAAQKTLDIDGDTVPRANALRQEKEPAKPVFTVPANATLLGSIAMTALIGRIPIDGTVNDPYPFKVLVGQENLTANGIDLPDVASAVISGTAAGDWTLACVRGQIRSLTFVFNDGTIRTIPPASESRGASNGAGNSDQNLGWISDPYGIPCVSGERRSNVEQYLGSQALITAAGAGTAALIQPTSNGVAFAGAGNGSAGSLGTVALTGQDALSQILASGVRDMSQWVNKLYGQAFAAIYVAPGAPVAVHIERALEIDYEPIGRKVNHRGENGYGTDLD
jgi:integrating conjugative element protein (TIGR03752 family)